MALPKGVQDIYASSVTGLFRKDKIPAILESDVPSVFIKIGAQSFTEAQKKQARTNIGACALSDVPSSVPTGTITSFAGKSVPTGFLLCNGAAVSRTTYKALFNVIGTTYGTGDGSTTFNLPNCNEKFLEGTTATGNVGKQLTASLPDVANHYHGTGYDNNNNSGYFVATPSGGAISFPWISGIGRIWWNGSGSGGSFENGTVSTNCVTTGSNTVSSTQRVQPPALQTLMIIKY